MRHYAVEQSLNFLVHFEKSQFSRVLFRVRYWLAVAYLSQSINLFVEVLIP